MAFVGRNRVPVLCVAGMFFHSWPTIGRAAVSATLFFVFVVAVVRFVGQQARITSWPSLETDLENAGALWVDEQVVVDGNMVSSRKPDDIPAFKEAMVALFSAAMHHAAHSE